MTERAGSPPDAPPTAASSPSGGLRRAPLLLGAWLPWLCVLAFAAVLVGPTLGGSLVFAATDNLERTAPWQATTTLTEATNLCVSDTVDAFWPLLLETRGRLADGEVPMWNDEVPSGSPLAANPLQGVLSPVVLPTYLLPDVLVPGWAKLVELAVVAAGCFLLSRRLGMGRGAAGLTTLAFVSSGFAVMWTGWPQARTIAFYPLVLWAVERVLQDRTWRSVVPFPLVVAGAVLGGFPALVVYLVYVTAAWVVLRWAVMARRGGWRAVGASAVRLAAGGAVAVALLLPQLVGMAEWLLQADVGDRDFGADGGLSPTVASTVMFPQALGTCSTEIPVWSPVSPVEGNAFVGVAVLFLALAAVLTPRPAAVPPGLVVLLAAVATLTFGASLVGSPFSDLLAALPGVGSSPLGRTRAVGGLALALLAGLGLHQLLSMPRPPTRGQRALLLLGTLGLLAVGAATLAYAHREAMVSAPTGWALVQDSFRPAVASAVLCVAVSVAVLVDLPRVRTVLVCLLPVAVLVEAAVFADAFWARPPASTFYRTTPVHELLEQEAEGERIASVGATMYHGAETAYDLRSLTGHSFSLPAWNDVVEEIDPLARRSPTTTQLSSTDVLGSPGLDRLSVSHLVAPPGSLPPGQDVTTTVPDGAVSVVLGPGGGAAVDAGAPALTAVYVDVVDPGRATLLRADLLDLDGRVVATTRAPVPEGAVGRRVLTFAGVTSPDRDPVAGVRVASSAPVRVRGTADGTVWVGQVRPARTLELVSDDGALVYRNADALPRFRWASASVVVGDPARRASAVGASIVADDTVVLAEDGVPFDGLPGTVTVRQDEGDEKRVSVSADGDGMLVVADGLARGWHAELDGQPVGLVAADHALMGVAVPEGDHEVVLRYDPPSPPAALVVSLVAGVLVLVSLVWLTVGLVVGLVVRRRRAQTGQTPWRRSENSRRVREA